jgi:hypothetical protein
MLIGYHFGVLIHFLQCSRYIGKIVWTISISTQFNTTINSTILKLKSLLVDVVCKAVNKHIGQGESVLRLSNINIVGFLLIFYFFLYFIFFFTILFLLTPKTLSPWSHTRNRMQTPKIKKHIGSNKRLSAGGRVCREPIARTDQLA